MDKRKVLGAFLSAALSISVLAGCGDSSSANSGSTQTASSAGSSTVTSIATSTASGSSGSTTASSTSGETVTLKIGASPTPHAEILEHVKPILAEQGVDLEITEFEDYVQPNLVVDSGELDANYFQHITYLNDFNEQNGTDLVDAGDIHYEPFGIYPGKKSSLDDIEDGDVISVPNDTTNEARALLLLQAQGLIKLKDGAGLAATVTDIAENPHNLKITELEAAQVSRAIPDSAFVILNGNYAQEAGLSVSKDAIAVESGDSEAAKNYVNVIAVKRGNENNEAIKKLVDVLKSDEVKRWIEETYNGAVVPYDGE